MKKFFKKIKRFVKRIKNSIEKELKMLENFDENYE